MDLTQIKYIFVAIMSAFSVVLSSPDSKQDSVLSESTEAIVSVAPTPNQGIVNKSNSEIQKTYPLFEEVNKKRSLNGINTLKLSDDLCVVANKRLDEQIENGKLDGHAGFKEMKTKNPNLASIIDKYSMVAEFLAYGGKNSLETVGLWDNSKNHQKLLNDSSFKYGCVVSRSLYAVAIAAN